MYPVVKLSIGLVHIVFLVENRNMVSKSKLPGYFKVESLLRLRDSCIQVFHVSCVCQMTMITRTNYRTTNT